jgi:RNA polymerase sigma factor FliA
MRRGRSPTTTELARELGIDAEEVERRQRAVVGAQLLHLDEVLGEDGDGAGTLGDLVREGDSRWLPHERLESRSLLVPIGATTARLPDDQRDVIVRSFFGGELIRDIAADLGVTEARVSQIRTEGLNAIRAYFSAVFDGVPPLDEAAPGVRRRTSFVEEMTRETTWRSRLDAMSGWTTPSLAAEPA